MPDEESGIEVGEVGGEASSDWVKTVEELEQQPAVVDADDIKFDFSHLDDDDLDMLDQQTERTLNRHAEIQENQHNQAKHTLRGVMIIIGALATAAPFIYSFLQSLEFAPSVNPGRNVAALILLFIIVSMINVIQSDIVETINSSFNILSPERTKVGRFQWILIVLGLLDIEAAEKESGGGIRSVSMLDELGPVVDDPEGSLRHGILSNRLNRIHRNEKVINANTRYLYLNYQRAIFALHRLILVVVLGFVVLMLLGVQF